MKRSLLLTALMVLVTAVMALPTLAQEDGLTGEDILPPFLRIEDVPEGEAEREAVVDAAGEVDWTRVFELAADDSEPTAQNPGDLEPGECMSKSYAGVSIRFCRDVRSPSLLCAAIGGYAGKSSCIRT